MNQHLKFKATKDVIPTEESAEEVIPEHEERHADAVGVLGTGVPRLAYQDCI